VPKITDFGRAIFAAAGVVVGDTFVEAMAEEVAKYVKEVPFVDIELEEFIMISYGL